MNVQALSTLLAPSSLRRLAGSRSFGRGEGYFANGHVRALSEHRGTIVATVRGTRNYRVTLAVKASKLHFSCTCPMGEDGDVCKHCVAVALAWREGGGPGPATGSRAAKPTVTLGDVRTRLAGWTKEALVDLVMEQVMVDDRLRRKLLLEAAHPGSKGLDLATYRRSIDEAADTGGFVHYRESWDYAHGIEDAVDSIEELLEQGHAEEVVELAEHALAAVEEALGSVDDSDGAVGSVLERLQEIHIKACRKARPDPEALARRLFAWELATEWDTFFGAAEIYAGVLGKKGLAAYRQLAEAEWARVPLRETRDRGSDTYDGRRFRITHIMETLAGRSGRIEDLVAVMERDLSSAYAYLQIAETYKKARRYDPALNWAERGFEAFPKRTDPRLRAFLADEYHRRKRHTEAMELIWTTFSEYPTLESCQELKRHAGRTGEWPAWRDKALARLREQLTKKRSDARATGWLPRGADASELVKVFLWEKDVAAALREAKAAGCSEALWLTLARKLEKDRPEEALPIYQARVEPTLGGKNKKAYREAVELLKTVSRLMIRLRRGDELEPYLDAIRTEHGRKRNFMTLLDRVRWPG